MSQANENQPHFNSFKNLAANWKARDTYNLWADWGAKSFGTWMRQQVWYGCWALGVRVTSQFLACGAEYTVCTIGVVGSIFFLLDRE